MSIWSKLINFNKSGNQNNVAENAAAAPRSIPDYAIIDIEVGISDKRIHDIGALKHNGSVFHKASKEELFAFLNDVDYICGHSTAVRNSVLTNIGLLMYFCV